MKYLKYIREWVDGKETTAIFKGITKELTEEEVIDYIKTNCKEFLESPKYITRGIGHRNYNMDVDDRTNFDFFVSDPSTLNRKSRDCANYYTLMIDNDPKWQDFPKRHKSFICTLGDTHMVGSYFIIPKDGSVWGVCPTHDIYTGFNESYSAGSFNSDITTLYKKLFNITTGSFNVEHPLNQEDYNIFLSQLDELTNMIKSLSYKEMCEILDHLYINNDMVTLIKTNYNENNTAWNGDMKEIFFNYYKKDKFQVKKYTELENSNYVRFDKSENKFETTLEMRQDKEIWTDSTCLFIKKGDFSGLKLMNDILKKVL